VPECAGLENRSRSATSIEHTDSCKTAKNRLSPDLSLAADECSELGGLIRAWPMLPEPIKAGILAMVKALVGCSYRGENSNRVMSVNCSQTPTDLHALYLR
jgi:hypothetical protein